MKLDRRHFLLHTSCWAVGASIPVKGRLAQVVDSVSQLSLAQDPRRPQYHLLPAANWMNDPNAPAFWKGKYHMFYQYNPDGAFWGDMHWGHAVSPDMVRWQHMPIALAPTPGGADAEGCFSGSAVIDEGRFRVVYTGIASSSDGTATSHSGAHAWKETQCAAIALDDDLTKWNKDPIPLIDSPPAGMKVRGFRDPCVWRQNRTWYLILGSGTSDQGGTVLLYRSPNGRDWEYVHELFRGSLDGTPSGNPLNSGRMWECPDFFPLGEKHILIHSTQGKSYWYCGNFDTNKLVFNPETGGALDYGSFYAPKTQRDRSNNRILWGWVLESRPVEEYKAAGWAGMMSLPRVLSLDKNNNLQYEIAPAVQELRQEAQRLILSDDDTQTSERIGRMRVKSCCGEIVIKFRLDGSPLKFALHSDEYRKSPWLICSYDPSASGSVTFDNNIVPIHPGHRGEMEFRFLIDGSVIESFLNKQAAYTKRFYYEGSSAPDIGVGITGSTANLTALTIWQMTPISSNRLTN